MLKVSLMIESSIKNQKWLCIGLYWPALVCIGLFWSLEALFKKEEKYFLKNLSLAPNKTSYERENIMLIGDFSLIVENKNLEVFMNTFDTECVIKKPTSFQSTSLHCTD